MDMDALPDEVLLMVFSQLEDGVAMLDSMSLVCKRWHRLVASDWRAWAGVTLEFQWHHWHYDPEAAGTLAMARVLLRAPALGCLSLDTWGNRYGDGAQVFLSALRRSRALLLRLDASSCYRLDAAVRQALFERLWRSRDHLRSLALELPLEQDPPTSDEDEDSDDEGVGAPAGAGWLVAGLRAEFERHAATADLDPVTVTLDGTELSTVGLLAGLQRLEHLRVGLHPAYEYAGELRGARLPRARELDLTTSMMRDDAPAAVAVDLLDAVSASLRTLRLPREPVPQAWLEAVGRCRGVRFLEGAFSAAAAAAGLPELRSLYASQSTPHPDKVGRAVAQAAAARRALRAVTQPFPELTTLTLEQLLGGYEDEDEDEGGLAGLLGEWRALLGELLRASEKVTRLSLYGALSRDEALLRELLASAPRVLHLDLGYCGPAYAAVVAAALPDLQTLTVDLDGNKDEAAREAHEAAAEEFRRLRPDVALKRS